MLDEQGMRMLLGAALFFCAPLLAMRSLAGSSVAEWRSAGKRLHAFCEQLGITDIVPGFARPVEYPFALLNRCQAANDPREGSNPAAPASKIREGAHFLKFAEAAYGLPGHNDDGEAWCALIKQKSGVLTEELARLETETHNDNGGDADCLRHFVAVDHASKSVVLAMSEALGRSTAGHAELFCGGRAHAGMARMAQKVWHDAGADVLEALEEYEDEEYSLVITGHSIGGGVAGLLGILLYYLRSHPSANSVEFFPRLPEAPDEDVAIKIYSYGSPPVFTPFPKLALATPWVPLTNFYSFVHASDVVPFLSARANKQLSAALHAIDDNLSSTADANAIVMGDKSPDAIAKIAASAAKAIVDEPTASELCVPSTTFVWLKGGGAVECETATADGILGGVPLSASMADDHALALYASALSGLAEKLPPPPPVEPPKPVEEAKPTPAPVAKPPPAPLKRQQTAPKPMEAAKEPEPEVKKAPTVKGISVVYSKKYEKKVIDVNPKASPPTIEKIYAPVVYP